jgi:hypothetical protein
MSVNVTWGDPDQSFLVVTFEKPWNWEEFQAGVKQTHVLVKEATHKVHLLLDIRNAGFPPNGAVRRFQDVGDVNDPHIDLVIYIAPRVLAHFVRSINSVLSAAVGNYSPPNFVFVQTLEEAYALMAQKGAQRRSA